MTSRTPLEFDAELVHPAEAGSWTVFDVPGSIEHFGTGNPVRVIGTIDDTPVAITLMPTGRGLHFGPVKAATRKTIGKAVGDTVRVRIEAAA
ncbi:DUF1905 domain-containing protein [Streptomyces sp. AC495_CC817]|uniref:DUF1905 domain-containing protein n=1 Tax=Streptomyces sp. AC495_CC817 TaxID=2823900 RepID=UPI001C256053|nr:DUF1905 domain-containing protein [Streptomyces sp. AC495_CC817]